MPSAIPSCTCSEDMAACSAKLCVPAPRRCSIKSA
ncbi:Uncharacterised protein [Vibrio cholerae]|nr:Uncharacterised protein [Vibrio cholerae]